MCLAFLFRVSLYSLYLKLIMFGCSTENLFRQAESQTISSFHIFQAISLYESIYFFATIDSSLVLEIETFQIGK